MEQNQKQRPEWMSDESVRDIDIRNLEFIQELHDNSYATNQKELMMKLMPKLKYAKEQGLLLSLKEVNTAIAAIKKYSTPEELKQIDKVLNKVKEQKNPSA